MIKVAINDCKMGMVLAADICKNGNKILSKGMILKARHLQIIKQMEIENLLIIGGDDAADNKQNNNINLEEIKEQVADRFIACNKHDMNIKNLMQIAMNIEMEKI